MTRAALRRPALLLAEERQPSSANLDDQTSAPPRLNCMKHWRCLSVGMTLFTFVPSFVSAECVQVGLKTAALYADVVFSGTVMSVSKNPASAGPGEIITFDVDRGWKGSVPKRFVLRSFTRTPEPFRFDVGTKYVVLAHKQTMDERELFGVPTSSPDTYGVAQCGDGTRVFAAAQNELNELGSGRPPN
jgi:hypothetical protein